MSVSFETDNGFGGAARMGLIVLSTDESLENEARGLFAGAPVNLLHARIPAKADVTPEDLATMEAELPGTARLLPQGLDVVGYGCTSGATVIGPDRVAALVEAVLPGVRVTNPITAVSAALKALGARRIAYVSPYVATVTAPMRGFLAGQGIETAQEASFNVAEDRMVARITEESTAAAVRDTAAGGGVDAVFVSCTNLRSFGVIDALEAELGLPVVSSNLALLWHMAQLAGLQDMRGPGRLFSL